MSISAMAESQKWKSKLLASGVPLEYDVGKILFEKGFRVPGEFPYTRYNFDGQVDCSIDLLADAYFPIQEDDDIDGEITFLIECKYRSDEKAWLFTPQIADEERGACVGGSLIRSFPTFTTYDYDYDPIYAFEKSVRPALKGVEINKGTGECQEKDIKHGINQLRYALPETIKGHILDQTPCHPIDCKPFFVVPILVTNAPLLLLDRDVTVEKIRKSKELDDFSTPVDLIDLHSSYANSFQIHSRKVFDEDFRHDVGNNNRGYRMVENQSASQSSYHVRNYPLNLLSRGQSSLFENFIVCNFNNVGTLIDQLFESLSKTLDGSKYQFKDEQEPS